jgi:Ca-activated chloride channel homolog
MKVYNLYIIALTMLLLSGCKQGNNNDYEAAAACDDDTAVESFDKTNDSYNPYPEYNTENEGYTETVENPFESPATKPLSTFSIDVDNAAYTNIRRMINNGEKIPSAAVRVEEMINFFKYNYPQPSGNQPFSINTVLSDCPWNSQHQLLKIGLQGKIIQNKNLPASNFVFLIDVSGSMDEANKLPLLKESMEVLVQELRPEDKISIVVYAGAAGVVLESVSGDKKSKIMDAFDDLQAGGSTAGGEGIDLAYQLAADNFIKGGNNRVILATDGDFNVGVSSENELQKLIEQKRKSGIFLTCLGFGTGNLQDNVMEVLADKGNGNYAYIDNIQEANRFLGKEFKGSMFAIAKDVKIQIEFNPKQIQSYRLIGYENRKLNEEDFKNDQIDAGELGSGHTVTALYEIIPNGAESSYSPTKLKYTPTKTVDNPSDELATIKFRYKKPNEETSNEIVKTIPNSKINFEAVSEDFKFASSVAWFGLKLKDSKYINNKDSDSIKRLAKKSIADDEDGYRSEFIRLVAAVND